MWFQEEISGQLLAQGIPVQRRLFPHSNRLLVSQNPLPKIRVVMLLYTVGTVKSESETATAMTLSLLKAKQMDGSRLGAVHFYIPLFFPQIPYNSFLLTSSSAASDTRSSLIYAVAILDLRYSPVSTSLQYTKHPFMPLVIRVL